MKFLLNSIAAILLKPLCLPVHMVAVVKSIVTIVMRHSSYHDSELLYRSQLENSRHAIRPCLQYDVSHLANIQVVHIIMIADVV